MNLVMRGVRRHIAAAMIVPMFALTTACSGAPSQSDGTEEVAQSKYDGQTLFRGVFFGDGPVAEKLPEIWGAMKTRDINLDKTLPAADAEKAEQSVSDFVNHRWS